MSQQVAMSFPETGSSWTGLRAELAERKERDYDWRSGRVPLYVYYEDEALLQVAREAYDLYFSENALGRKAFPSVAALERDVVDMALSLFRAPPGADGSFTSGGTESLFLAIKTARDQALSLRQMAGRPAIVIPQTCHATVNKAAHYLGVDVVRVPVRADYRADLAAMEAAIDDRTIMLFGSAPGYPQGVYDPIPELGRMAQAHGLWLHVDACLGGFLAPFVREIGYPVPDFDLSVPGVSSLSADLHKYGFAAKGASVVLYGDGAAKEFQRFEFRDWPRGLYATETFLGTRPGGAIASAWAVLRYLGRTGYRRIARTIMETKDRLVAGIEAIRGLEVVRPSDLCILLFRSIEPGLDINAVAENMERRGWFVGRSLEPMALHLALNPVHAAAVDAYLSDLAEAVAEARVSGQVGRVDEHTY